MICLAWSLSPILSPSSSLSHGCLTRPFLSSSSGFLLVSALVFTLPLQGHVHSCSTFFCSNPPLQRFSLIPGAKLPRRSWCLPASRLLRPSFQRRLRASACGMSWNCPGKGCCQQQRDAATHQGGVTGCNG